MSEATTKFSAAVAASCWQRVLAQRWTLGLLLLLAAGSAVRLGSLDGMVSFHSTRQFHCALIARATYYGWIKPAEDPRRIVAEQAAARRGKLEPPVVQTLAALGYVAVGGENLTVPRVISAIAWLIGGVLLFELTRRLASSLAALLAVGYFLLVPFGVLASQSFQPDPLMVTLMLAAFLTAVMLDQAPTRAAAARFGLLAGLAILVKPVCVFGIAALYLVLALRRMGLRKLARSSEPYIVAVLACAPTAAWYLPAILSGGRLSAQADQSFRPELLGTAMFWRGWAEQALEVAPGPIVASAALLGLVLAPDKRMRAALWALWFAYIAYGLTFNYHISTHNYYQLPALPLVALSLAALIERARVLAPFRSGLPPAAAVSVKLPIAVMLAVGLAAIGAQARSGMHGAHDSDPRGYREIGELVHHSTKVVFVTPHASGGPLEFVGELSGWPWPAHADLRRAKRRGRPPLQWEKLFAERLAQGAEYFVSTPADELKKQRALGKHLRKRFKLISSSEKYLVYDLRAPR